jgi:hypothetical protein
MRDWIFTIAVFCGLLYGMLKVAPHEECVVPIKATVIAVGGCNRVGTCGVMTDHGTGTAVLPAPGEVLSWCHEYKVKFGFF